MQRAGIISSRISMRKEEGLRDQLFHYGNIGIEMLVAVLLGTFGGYLLDRWLHTRPWLMIVGFVLGAAAGFRNIFRLMVSEEKKEKKT